MRIAYLLVALAACGSDTSVTDAGTPVDAPGPELRDAFCEPCNHVAQTGCQQQEKCSAPFVGCGGTCVPEGQVPLGGTCAANADGSDDCIGGHLCVDGQCQRMCTRAPDSCSGDGQTCMAVEGLTDLYYVGVCRPPCDALAQDCVAWDSDVHGLGCYVSLETGETGCVPASGADGEVPAGQGDACEYHFRCAVGYGCNLPDAPVNPTGNTCAFFCDVGATGGPACADGPGASFTCVPINGFYDDTPNVHPSIGMCIDCAVWTDAPGCQ